jgi:hypothetical protein
LSWDEMISRFVRVLPHDYKRVLEAEKRTANFALPVVETTVKSADVSG